MFSRLFDIVASVGETIYDEICRNDSQKHSQWIKEVYQNAKNNRRKYIQSAHEIWLRRNEEIKFTISKEAAALVSAKAALINSKHDLSLHAACETEVDLRNNDMSDIFLTDPLDISDDEIALQFPYERDGFFYRGCNDEFISHLDAFMTSELKSHGHTELLVQWKMLVEEARTIVV